MCTSHDVDNSTESNDPRDGYQLDGNWPDYPADMQFEMGSGIAVDKRRHCLSFHQGPRALGNPPTRHERQDG